MAHGKKIGKKNLVGIQISDICKRILAPDVPQSLRLQGILIGGVALVFSRQQLYLLEDLQDMVVRGLNTEESWEESCFSEQQPGRMTRW